MQSLWVSTALLLCFAGRIHSKCTSLGGSHHVQVKAFNAEKAISGLGACKLASDDSMVAGISPRSYSESKVCGECVMITGPNGHSITVKVIDKCRKCEDKELQVSQEAFDSLTDDDAASIIDVTVEPVPCDVTGNLGYKFKEGSNKHWFGIQFFNHRLPIRGVEVRGEGSDGWVSLERTNRNFFIKTPDDGRFDMPFEFRVSATNGARITLPVAEIEDYKRHSGPSQFGDCVPGDSDTGEEGETEEGQEEEEDEPEPIFVESHQVSESEEEDESFSGSSSCKRTLPARKEKGDITHYSYAHIAAAGKGNCMLDTGGNNMVGAINKLSYKNAETCGMCVEMTNPESEEIMHLQIVDTCPECHEGDIDLSEEAFAKFAPLKRGRMQVTWRVVECPVTGNFRYRFKDGSSKYWFGIQVTNHRYPVKKVQVRTVGTKKWATLERQAYNFFVKFSHKGVIEGPLDIRIQSIRGQTVMDKIEEIKRSENEYIEGNTQFQECED